MPSKKFEKEILQEITQGGECEGYWCVEDKIIGTSRWSVQRRLIFCTPENEFFKSVYQHGATEYQDEYPWENEGDEVECTQVYPHEVMTTEYKEKPQIV